MYKLSDLTSDSSTSFLSSLTAKWMELHKDTEIFRYKIDNLEERIVDGKYLLQLNPDRQTKRRTPEAMNNIQQPFDEKKFNFNKVSPEEVLFSISEDADTHTVLVNVSPISQYHSLICPSVNKCLPQVVTLESLQLVIQIMFLAEDWDIRIGFNSMCGFASVNHLHYHIFVEKNSLYVEKMKWHHLKGNTYCLDKTYPVPAFCFELQKQSYAQTLKEVWKVLEYFLNKSIAHNILFTKRRLDGNGDVCVIIWPRRSTTGAKKLAAFNVAVLELSGWFPIYDVEQFKNLQAADLENELAKWIPEDFNKICEDIKLLL
ncbi:GDP-D-glucose phosphorylase 1 [Helicoverpa zea]|uniref:GDP-D-glucose phosphorylase 1 n=1 Tax=Helicoverpa zea TaxID=7113 RepID=UPI001F58CCFE|nr:GDP-D-glucose phosphorylase 1 [Helicoverpa zea]